MQNIDFFNNMQVCIDWLEFTFEICFSHIEVMKMLGLYGSMELMEKGGYGYKKMYRHNRDDITLFCDGNCDMGVHVRVKGSAVRSFLEMFLFSRECDTPFGKSFNIDFNYSAENVLAFVVKEILGHGHFTRIDVAIDDINDVHYTVREIYDCFEKHLVVSKMRTYKFIDEKEIDGLPRGCGLYCGSRQSDVMLRIYDKGLQKSAGYQWVRWEFEVKGDKVDELAKVISSQKPVGEIAFGMLNNTMRIINNDRSRRKRCNVSSKWIDFVSSAKKIRLTIPKREFSIEGKLDWINRQVMPTVAGLVNYFDGDMSFIYNNLNEHYNRLSASDRILFENKE